ncbi:MmcQ/YjbR family DNA-binding protein [Paenibacillus sp. N1-5-1-14]|uniref:MmcQ/YjbR family DNA-binding protein n=1 Tax=Paenibacillus radicibacter TaxID=2972488 RepID=UPI00215985CD|nr:MmcQ/YjbR family DNA-binding protein [Paenibacillus radicibacter]MCR8644320.1 MmcQ/YjbR family DNA-binding protein [Paenibacillus radicibacter]
MQHYEDYCLSKAGAELTYPFGDNVRVFKVGNKMFALLPSEEPAPTISLKCDPMRAASLREQYKEVKPGYHLNKNHWNTITLTGTLSEQEIHVLIDHSYDLVYKGLTKVEKAAIAEDAVS